MLYTNDYQWLRIVARADVGRRRRLLPLSGSKIRSACGILLGSRVMFPKSRWQGNECADGDLMFVVDVYAGESLLR